MPGGMFRLLKAMIGTANNETGEIQKIHGRSLAVLGLRAKMSERTARRWYAQIVEHGWHEPGEGSGKHRVFGMLTIPDAPVVEQGHVRECERCGKPLRQSSRADARTCSDRCRQAARRARLADSRDKTVAVSRDTSPVAVAVSRDLSRIECVTGWPIAVTDHTSDDVEDHDGARDSTDEKGSNSTAIPHGDGDGPV